MKKENRLYTDKMIKQQFPKLNKEQLSKIQEERKKNFIKDLKIKIKK